MKQNQQFRGMGLILLVMALIFFASTLSQQGNLFSDEMTYQEFMTSVENGAIETAPVSYTHLDVYKRQEMAPGVCRLLRAFSRQQET